MIINPSPGPSPISITIEHGIIESKNDIAKTVNVSLRLVKFLIIFFYKAFHTSKLNFRKYYISKNDVDTKQLFL